MWLLFGIIYSLLEKGLLGELEYYPSTKNKYDFSNSFWSATIGSLLVGIFLGTVETLYLRSFFNKRSFLEKIFFKTLIYLLCIVVFLVVLTFISSSTVLKVPFYHPSVMENLKAFAQDFVFISIVLYAGAFLALTLFITDISNHVGQGVFHNFLLGRYHNPVQEERIFMFLDMKSSTTYAERLGHVRYFELLRSYYADMTHAILASSAEIYQYVGDEVILTWNLKKGLNKDACIVCFYEIKKALDNKKNWYIKKFGFFPTFKAGLHYGTVTTGEIGEIKKEILYTGDVINTTARIQDLCNEHGTSILISQDLFSSVSIKIQKDFAEIGSFALRGKTELIKLYGHRLSN